MVGFKKKHFLQTSFSISKNLNLTINKVIVTHEAVILNQTCQVELVISIK
jgi:hypothetical protein